MLIITDVNRELEIISKESPKDNEDGDSKKNTPNGQHALWATQFYTKRMISYLSGKGLPSFSGVMISDMYNLLKRNLDCIILHIGTNEASRNTTNGLLDINQSNNKSCKVIISTLTMRVDDQKTRSVVSEVNKFLKELIYLL